MVLSVSTEIHKIIKPYLGGWRHKITGTVYLNATSQTDPLFKQLCSTCSRAVQYIETKDRVTQSTCHRSTQMWRHDCYIPNKADKYMTVKAYENYAEMQLRLNLDGQVRKIQKCYRAYKWIKYMKECAEVYRDMLQKCNRYEEEKAITYKLRHKQNILRQIHPQSRADFDMLYSLIEKWRVDCLKNIKSRFFKAAQCAENYMILEKTIDMFNHIDKHKQAIQKLHKKRRTLKFLTVNCKPIRWVGYKGKSVEMVTMKIQKAREFKGLYDALSNHDTTLEERIELLTNLKKSLKMHNCLEAFELLILLDQEIVLLNRDIKDLSLYYLNERITHAYLNFVRMNGICGCETVDHSSIDGELRVPLDTETKICRSCLKLLPRRRFLLHSRTRMLSICINCSSLARRNTAHVDYDPYIFILNCVQTDEKLRRCNSSLAFMMQEHDIYYLVNHIWHGRSAMSKTNDLFILRLVRYNKDIDWAPWNCVLLTEDEADTHFRINDPATVYSEHLINQINLAHQTAKIYFKQLMNFEKY